MFVTISLKQVDGKYRLIAKNDKKWVKQANKFLDAVLIRGLSIHTIRAYGMDLVLLLRWIKTRGKFFKDIDHSELLEWIAQQQEKNAKPKSINRRLATAQIFYRFCFNKDVPRGKGSLTPAPFYMGPGLDYDLGLFSLPRRSCLKLRVKEPKKVVEPLTQEQVKLLIGTCSRYRDLAIVELMLLCGLRSCEVMAIKLSDVNILEGKILVRGKGSKERTLPLPILIASTIEKYNSLERPIDSKVENLFVVLQGKNRGKQLTAAGLRSIFRYRRRDSRISNANAHRARHTFGASMAREKVPLSVLQRLMGHHHPKVTANYIYLSMADIAEEFYRATDELQKRYALS